MTVHSTILHKSSKFYFLLELNQKTLIQIQLVSKAAMFGGGYHTVMDVYIKSYRAYLKIFLNLHASSLYPCYHSKPTTHDVLPGLLKQPASLSLPSLYLPPSDYSRHSGQSNSEKPKSSQAFAENFQQLLFCSEKRQNLDNKPTGHSNVWSSYDLPPVNSPLCYCHMGLLTSQVRHALLFPVTGLIFPRRAAWLTLQPLSFQ